MSDIASIIADLVRAGVDPELIGRTAAAFCAREAVLVPDEAAERRRATDRERKRLRKSAEFVVNAGSTASPPPKEAPHTPEENSPSTPTTQQEKTLRVQKKASRLPADWQLPDEWRQDAITAGLDPSRINLEADKIRDWSRSSKNGAKLDWRATWRNWCREAAGRSPPARGSPAFKAPSQSDVFRLIAERAANGQDGDDRGRIRPALSDLRTG